MRSTPFPSLMFSALLLCMGFGAGWWLRGPAPEPLRYTEPSASASTREVWVPPVPREAQPRLRSDTLRLGSAAPPAEEADSVQDLRTLLEAQAFAAAMDLYRDTEHYNSGDAAQLKSVILGYLERYLQSQDAEALTSLVDAFLALYYDDIDVLLVLARYHLQADYFSEGARTFQLAFAYSLARTDHQQQVMAAFRTFVGQVDERLAGREDWRELTRFYEHLQLLDLIQPLYELRLAELYLRYGEPETGYELLRRLVAIPTVAAQATALLEGAETSAASPRRRPPPDTVALGALGNHYYLPLRLNNTLDIQLLIDTGASTTTLSRSKFDAIRRRTPFTELGPQMFSTASGVAKGTVYRVASLQVGQHVLSDVDIAVLDFDMPAEVDGLLGMNVLQHFRFNVDQDERLLHLQPR